MYLSNFESSHGLNDDSNDCEAIFSVHPCQMIDNLSLLLHFSGARWGVEKDAGLGF